MAQSSPAILDIDLPEVRSGNASATTLGTRPPRPPRPCQLIQQSFLMRKISIIENSVG